MVQISSMVRTSFCIIACAASEEMGLAKLARILVLLGDLRDLAMMNSLASSKTRVAVLGFPAVRMQVFGPAPVLEVKYLKYSSLTDFLMSLSKIFSSLVING